MAVAAVAVQGRIIGHRFARGPCSVKRSHFESILRPSGVEYLFVVVRRVCGIESHAAELCQAVTAPIANRTPNLSGTLVRLLEFEL